MAPHQGYDLLPKVIKANNQTAPREKEQGIDQNKTVASQIHGRGCKLQYYAVICYRIIGNPFCLSETSAKWGDTETISSYQWETAIGLSGQEYSVVQKQYRNPGKQEKKQGLT